MPLLKKLTVYDFDKDGSWTATSESTLKTPLELPKGYKAQKALIKKKVTEWKLTPPRGTSHIFVKWHMGGFLMKAPIRRTNGNNKRRASAQASS